MLTSPARQLLLSTLLAKDGIISNNGKCFLKELILRRDPRLIELLDSFESRDAGDTTFIESIHDLIEDESFALYNELFADTTLEVGKKLSKEERDRKCLDEKSLIYGEVDYHSFYRVLRKINPKPGGIFYDLGSGTAKAVLAARFTRDFTTCIGIEILQGLHDQGIKVVDKYNEDFRKFLWAGNNQHAQVYEGSFLNFPWTDGDVVFANSTCFDDELMKDMSDMAEAMKPGAIFVTFTKGLMSKKFEVLERKRHKMSWGPATVFIHRRLNEDGTPIGPPSLQILPSDSTEYDKDPEATSSSKYSYVDDLEEDESSDDGSSSDDDDTDDGDEEEYNFEDLNGASREAFGLNENDTAWSRPDLAALSPSRWAEADGGIMSGMDGLNSPQDSALLRRKAMAGKAANRWNGGGF